jgi:iron(III) transport system ATP-binding protein
VKRPRLLLLDEPLSNLDAKLREDMRLEIKDVVNKLRLSALYVTHDQAEALAMSDRIFVMQKGRVLQEGTPLEIYTTPANEFVANFIGSANLFEGELVSRSDNQGRVRMRQGELTCVLASTLREGERVLVSARPEEIRIYREAPPERTNLFSGKIAKVTFLGDSLDCRIASIAIDQYIVRAKLLPEISYKEGEPVYVQLPSRKTLAIPWADSASKPS